MKYFIYISESQIEYLKQDFDINSNFNDYIESTELEEHISLFLSHIERIFFLDYKSKLLEQQEEEEYKADKEEAKITSNTLTPRDRENIKLRVSREMKRIKDNVQYMPLNNKYECLVDLLKHSSLDWMEKLQYQKTQQLSDFDIKKQEEAYNNSFKSKRLNKLPYQKKSPSQQISRTTSIITVEEDL